MITKPDDLTLMAFADGTLAQDDCQRIDAALTQWPELADVVRAFKESREALANAFGPMAVVPAPPHMVDIALRGSSNVTPPAILEAMRIRRHRMPSAGWIQAVAACVALASAGIAGYAGGRSAEPQQVLLAGRVSPGSWLSATLSNLPSGERDSHRNTNITTRATYVGTNGDICREFELNRYGERTAAIACRKDEAWNVQVALSAFAPAGAGEYRPASGSDNDVLDSVLDRIGAGDALSAGQEDCLRKSGWSDAGECLSPQD